MKFFWPIYFLSAFVGTAGVYVAAPLTRPYIAKLLETPGAAAPAAHSAGAPAPAVSRPVPPAAVAARPAAPALPAASAAAEEEVSPAENDITRVWSAKDKPGWGITFQRAPYYNLEGTRMGLVPAGVLLDYRAARESSAGNMVECILLENDTPSAPLLIGRKDVYLFTGTHRKLSARQRADLLAYYAINGKIGMRKNELLQAAAAKNPFFTEYNKTYRTYMTHIDEAKALAVKRDRATEQEKTALEDHLREMKVAEASLRKDYDAIHQKFRQWKDEHRNELAKAENDPDVIKWTKEMDALRPRIAGLAF